MKVIIFGIQDTAQLAHYYLTTDSEYDVVAFSVHEKYKENQDSFCGLPLVSFEDVELIYPPDEFVFFAPMTYKNMNQDRVKVYKEIKEKGYRLINYISSKATVFDNNEFGENCFVLEDNTIQPFVKVGNNVVLWSGNHIGHHGVIKDNVFITSQVVISGHCTIGENSFIGVNATIRDYTELANFTFVGMGANITENTSEYSVYITPKSKKMSISSLDL